MRQKHNSRQRTLFAEPPTGSYETIDPPALSRAPDSVSGSAAPKASEKALAFIAPDRQDDLYEDEPPPRKGLLLSDMISVERDCLDIDGPPHRFWIRTGDVVEAVVGAEVVVGLVVAIDAEFAEIELDVPALDALHRVPVEHVFPVSEEEESLHWRLHAERWERLIHRQPADSACGPSLRNVGISNTSTAAQDQAARSEEFAAKHPNSAPQETNGCLGDTSDASAQVTAFDRLNAMKQRLIDAPIIPWSDEFAEDEFLDLPTGCAVELNSECWSNVLEIRPAHVMGYDACACEWGLGGPYLLAWHIGERYFVRELTEAEARDLQELCLITQAEPLGQSETAKPSFIQRPLWD